MGQRAPRPADTRREHTIKCQNVGCVLSLCFPVLSVEGPIDEAMLGRMRKSARKRGWFWIGTTVYCPNCRD